MARGKNVKKLLLDASQAAMFAGIEIHNKPNIRYRYPTAIILIINAWELALKAYEYDSQICEKRKIAQPHHRRRAVPFFVFMRKDV